MVKDCRSCNLQSVGRQQLLHIFKTYTTLSSKAVGTAGIFTHVNYEEYLHVNYEEYYHITLVNNGHLAMQNVNVIYNKFI